MKIDFNVPIKDLSGTPVEGNTLGQMVANALAVDNESKDPLKFWELALQLTAGKVVDLDSSDKTLLTDFIKGSRNLNNFVKGQALMLLK